MNSSIVFNKNFEKFFCSNSSLHSKLVSKGLITDSGVNQHITYTDKNLIDVIDISYLKIKVTRPNRTEAFITRIENMPLTDYLTLYDVLVVPEYCVSLMSVHKVARDSKLVIAFDEMHCYVMNQDLRKGKILGTTKQTREPFPLSDHVSTELGELVHLDLWGPYKVTSREGFRFFLTIVDDFSRAVWDYLLKSKTKVFENVLVFYNIIKTQFKWNITVFRSDNGTEFVNQQFYGFCESNDYLPLLNRKSPYDLVYNKPPSLKHLRSFVCLAYATILNSHDKFGSRDVKFFEDIFPFKQNNSTGINNYVQDNDAGHSQDADASANENGSFAADEENNNNSEGNGLHDQSQDNGVEPKTYLEASQHKHWVDAMIAEMDALYRNNTWEIIDLPVGRKAIGSKWDFDGTFSPVVKIVTVRCLINLVVQNGWSLFQMDINNAFLYDDLEETVYMTLPPGYFPDNETKSFGDVFIALLVYVDDILITGNILTKIEKVKQVLKIKFMIKDLGKLKYFLGIEVLDTPKGICLNQRKYYLEFIDEFGLLARKPSNLHMHPNISLTSEPSDTDPLLDNVTEYQKLIGKLIYLTTTRPDIAYIVFCLSQFMHNPLRSHLKTALKMQTRQDVKAILPKKSQTILDAPLGYVGLYTRHFSLSNLRLLIPHFICEVLNYFKVYVSRFNPFRMVKLTTFVVMCKAYGGEPTVDLLRYFLNLGPAGDWLTLSNRGNADAPKSVLKPITYLRNWKDRFFFIENKIIPSEYPKLLLSENKLDKKSFKDKVPLHPETDPLYDQIATYPCIVRTFPDPILYLAGLKTTWEHSPKRLVIYHRGQGIFVSLCIS
ncbi:ribonuclease H-like domain-containing protein [Tanacetum coccineum]